MFAESPSSYAICGICFLEDDFLQLYYPHQAGGPNQLHGFHSGHAGLTFGSSVAPGGPANARHQLSVPSSDTPATHA